jgi:hypothetical protein
MESLEDAIVKRKGVEISKILVGTSPFIAAGQFEKSRQYYVEFVLKRGGVASILSWCFENGFDWVQAIDVDFLAREIRMASEESWSSAEGGHQHLGLAGEGRREVRGPRRQGAPASRVDHRLARPS